MSVFKPCGLGYRLWGVVALVLLALLPFPQYSVLVWKSWALPAALGLGLWGLIHLECCGKNSGLEGFRC